MIVGGAILFVVLVVIIIRQLTSKETLRITNDTIKLQDCLLRPGVLFFDNFDEAIAGKWTSIRGSWAYQNGKLVQVQVGGQTAIYLINGKLFDNFTMEFRTKLNFDGTNGNYPGIVFRSNRLASNFYLVKIGRFDVSNVFFLIRKEYITSKGSGSYTFESVEPEVEVTIKIRVYGQIMQIYLNGKKIGTSFPLTEYNSGLIGLIAASSNTNAALPAEFDTVCVYKE